MGAAPLVAWAVLLPTMIPPALAAVVPQMTLEEMTGRAEVIVVGRVEEARAAWTDDRRMIVTRVTLAVDRAVKGGPRSRVAFEVPGGRVGETTLVASGAPVFRPGERVALFLDRSPAPGEAEEAVRARPLGVTGWNLGKMEVRKDPLTGRDLVYSRAAGPAHADRLGRPLPERAEGGPVELSRFLETIEGFLKQPPRDGSR
jgi:hypothetical protein